MKSEAGDSELEIIFVSSDRDEASYTEYYGKMSFLSLPFQSEFHPKLQDKFKVKGIPSLIVLDGENGDVKDVDGRGTVIDAMGNIKKPLTKWA